MSFSKLKFRGRRGSGAAFTLIEVMVSIAIVLVLIIGINQVFKITADTVGTGQALSAKIRDGRAAQAVFTNELAHLAPDGPFLIIDSNRVSAFRNANDAKADLDGDPMTIDIDGDNQEGTGPGEKLSLTGMTDRNHRIDMLSFFTRDLYPRQTGGISGGTSDVYVAPELSNEAWVTYGHLRIYDQNPTNDLTPNRDRLDTAYLYPGSLNATTNPKNFYADDWVIGRVVMLMTQPNSTGNIVDRNLKNQVYWQRANVTTTTPLSPLQTGTLVNDGSTTATMTDAGYDLVGTSISNFSTILATYIEHTKYYTGASQLATLGPDDWWTMLPVTSQSSSPVNVFQRFRCNPYPTKPLDSRKVARTVPSLLNNCTQFVVEFAGDYLTQDPTGATSNITALQPDGQIDYYFEHPFGSSGPAVRRIRWYGFPRDVAGPVTASNPSAGPDGSIPGPLATPPSGISVYDNMVDVIPVRDAMMAATGTAPLTYTAPPSPNPVAFERHLTKDITPAPAPAYALLPRADYANAVTGVQPGEYYTAAWGPTDTNRPKMIRIIATVDDPNGRLGVGQTYEYVINLP